jgi:hypothetical protein
VRRFNTHTTAEQKKLGNAKAKKNQPAEKPRYWSNQNSLLQNILETKAT